MEAAPGFEPGNRGFADPCLASWLRRLAYVPALTVSRTGEKMVRHGIRQCQREGIRAARPESFNDA